MRRAGLMVPRVFETCARARSRVRGHRIGHGAGVRAGGGAVEIDERLAPDLLPEDGKVLPDLLDVQARRGERSLGERRHATSLRLSRSGNLEVTSSRTRARRGASGIKFTISLAKA